MSYENPWIYNNEDFTGPDENTFGFVYRITNKIDNRKYIGKKFFWNSRTKITTVNKKKKKKRIRVESDWKTYYGSSKDLLTDVEKHGIINFNREIIRLCGSKSECSYWELDAQVREGALLKEEYYNSWIMVRVRKEHLKAGLV
jgi:hypothetical protein